MFGKMEKRVERSTEYRWNLLSDENENGCKINRPSE